MPTPLHLETLAFHAWPAAEVVDLTGWRLRATEGVTRRANSVWPNGRGKGRMTPPRPSPAWGGSWARGGVAAASGDLTARVAAVEAHYAQRGLPAVFQISPAALPEELDDVLAARGYALHAPTLVQTATVAAMRAALAPRPAAAGMAVEVAAACEPAWFDLYCAAEQVSGHAAATRLAILRRIAPACAFALLRIDGIPAAVGHGVAEAGWLGIYSMATAPAFRRRGAARALLHTLAAWAQTQGAEHAYLQVMQQNTPAQVLYAGAGFRTEYRYYYRVRENRDNSE